MIYSFKHIVMSLLLLSFMLLVVHDYVFINSHQTDEIFKEKITAYSSEKIQELQTHHNIHILLEMPFLPKQIFVIKKQNEKPSCNKKYLLSRINSVLLRPPLA